MKKIIVNVFGKNLVIDEPERITILMKENKRSLVFDLKMNVKDLEKLKKVFKRIKDVHK